MVRELRENGFLLKDLNYISEAEAAIALNVSEQTLIEWRKRQVGPPFSMIGRRFIYAVPRLKQWVEAGGTRAAEAKAPATPVKRESRPKRPVGRPRKVRATSP